MFAFKKDPISSICCYICIYDLHWQHVMISIQNHRYRWGLGDANWNAFPISYSTDGQTYSSTDRSR